MRLRVAVPTHRRHLPLLAGGATWAALAVLMTVLLYNIAARDRLEQVNTSRQVLSELRDAADHKLEAALAAPETVATLVGVSDRVDERRFRAMAAQLVQSNPSIRAMSIAPDNVIALVHPSMGNEAALGLNFAHHPQQYPAVQQAMEIRRTVVDKPIQLVQGGVGLASRTPIFVDGPEGRDSRYWGVVSVIVGLDELFSTVAPIAQRNGLRLAVRRIDGAGTAGELVSGVPAVFEAKPVSIEYRLPGDGLLQLAAVPAADSKAGIPLWIQVSMHLFAVGGGLLAWRLVAGHQHHSMLASRDALTGLLNRKAFDHRLSEAMLDNRALSHGLVLMDLDDFKPINDTHGHSAGDVVLQQVAARLQQFAGIHAATAYRIGGDEFALLMHNVRASSDVAALARRALERVSQPVLLDHERSVVPGASVGVVVFPVGGQLERAMDVFDRADRALYRSKGLGGRCVHMEQQAETARVRS